MSDHASTQTSSTAVASSSSLFSTEELVRLLALGGALLYGSAFLGYRSYYGRLGLTPEALGVSNLFVLVRSLGFLVLIMCVCALMAGLVLAYSLTTDVDRSLGGWLVRFVAGCLVGAACGFGVVVYVYGIVPGGPGSRRSIFSYAVLTILMGLALTYNRSAAAAAARRRLVVVSIVAILAVVVPTVSLVLRGDEMARRALQANKVAPFALFGIPVLDVSADPVQLDWIGSKDQRPRLFGGATPKTVPGVLLGEASGSTYFVSLEDKAIARVPSNQVLVRIDR